MIGSSVDADIRPSKSDPALNVTMNGWRNSVRERREKISRVESQKMNPLLRVYVKKNANGFVSSSVDKPLCDLAAEHDSYDAPAVTGELRVSVGRFAVHSSVLPTATHFPSRNQANTSSSNSFASTCDSLADSLECLAASAALTMSSEELLQDVITIEGLRSLYSSCFSCGVSWQEDHVSLDCKECGGYAMKRPCPECDGKCESLWERNLSVSHEQHKAGWDGRCLQSNAANGCFSLADASLKRQSPAQTLLTPSLKVA